MAHDLKWFIKEVRSITIRNLAQLSPQLSSSPSSSQSIITSSSSSSLLSNNLNKLPRPSLDITAESITSTSESSESSIASRRLFFGHALQLTCNPSWTTSSIDFLAIHDLSLDCQDVLLTIRDVDNNDEIIGRFPIDLRRIVRLGNIQLMLIDSLPLNSVLLSTDNGFYITETLFVKLKALGLIPVASRFVEEDDTEENDPAALRDAMTSAMGQMTAVKSELMTSLERNEQARKVTQRSAALARLEMLRAEAATAEYECQQEEALEQAEAARLKEICSVESELESLAGLKEEIAKLNTNCQSKKEELLKLQFLFECRQLKLLSEVRGIYPIERAESGEYTIRGIELHLESNNDEQISTALGYIVHLLLLISKYLEVPLRYQLIFFASRSRIRDAVSNPSVQGAAMATALLPLYKAGVDKLRFDLAVMWLRVDIEQLLQTRGLNYNPKQGMLYNIQQIFSCESCLSLST